jgi:glycolate oxidase
MTLASAIAADLRARIRGSLVTDPELLPAYGEDFLENRGAPGVVVRVGHADDVSATLRYATERGIAVVPRAAGTNVAAAFLPSPERIMLDLRGLNRVLAVDAEARRAVVQPGVLNGDLNAQLSTMGLFYAPDPASAAMSTIGGNLATNAGGLHCLKYGVTVHHVRAATWVLPDGHPLTLDVDGPGPDLLGVMIGSEGTLGVVTEATVRLTPIPAVTRTLLAVFDRTEDAVEAVSATIAAGLVPAAMEYWERAVTQIIEDYEPTGYPTDAAALVLVDLDGDAERVMDELHRVEAIFGRTAREVFPAEDDATRAVLWRGRRNAAPALNSGGRRVYFGDITVPRECLPSIERAIREIAARHGLTIVNVGHIGDGNFHPTAIYAADDPVAYKIALAADDEIAEAALAVGGTITGEHGVGSAKRRQMSMRFAPAEIAAMRAVKRVVDPSGLLNPGIMLPDLSPDEPPMHEFAATARASLDVARGGRSWDSVKPRMSLHGSPVGAVPTLDAANLTVSVPAATSLKELAWALEARGLLSPFPASEVSVGYAIGAQQYRAAVHDSLLALTATLPDGATVRFGSNAVKDVAGYDLKRLFTGSSGAFGRVHEVVLRIQPKP